jgi:hypothetical protein
MELVVDLSTGGVTLDDHEEMTRFAVRAVPADGEDAAASGALGALAAALSLHDAGTVDPGGDVFVPTAAIERLAGQAATASGRPLGPEWRAGLTGMLEFAATHGWVTEDGAVRAHVEWRN